MQADTTIGVTTAFQQIGTFGSQPPASSPTLGQSITVPTGEGFLTSFTLNFKFLGEGSGGQLYNAYVYAWSGLAVTGPALFTSGALTAPNGPSAITVNTGYLPVTAGQEYALLFSTLAQATTTSKYFFTMNFSSDAYTGGRFIWNNGDSFAALTTNSWNPSGGQGISCLRRPSQALPLPM